MLGRATDEVEISTKTIEAATICSTAMLNSGKGQTPPPRPPKPYHFLGSANAPQLPQGLAYQAQNLVATGMLGGSTGHGANGKRDAERVGNKAFTTFTIRHGGSLWKHSRNPNPTAYGEVVVEPYHRKMTKAAFSNIRDSDGVLMSYEWDLLKDDKQDDDQKRRSGVALGFKFDVDERWMDKYGVDMYGLDANHVRRRPAFTRIDPAEYEAAKKSARRYHEEKCHEYASPTKRSHVAPSNTGSLPPPPPPPTSTSTNRNAPTSSRGTGRNFTPPPPNSTSTNRNGSTSSRGTRRNTPPPQSVEESHYEDAPPDIPTESVAECHYEDAPAAYAQEVLYEDLLYSFVAKPGYEKGDFVLVNFDENHHAMGDVTDSRGRLISYKALLHDLHPRDLYQKKLGFKHGTHYLKGAYWQLDIYHTDISGKNASGVFVRKNCTLVDPEIYQRAKDQAHIEYARRLKDRQ